MPHPSGFGPTRSGVKNPAEIMGMLVNDLVDEDLYHTVPVMTRPPGRQGLGQGVTRRRASGRVWGTSVTQKPGVGYSWVGSGRSCFRQEMYSNPLGIYIWTKTLPCPRTTLIKENNLLYLVHLAPQGLHSEGPGGVLARRATLRWVRIETTRPGTILISDGSGFYSGVTLAARRPRTHDYHARARSR